VISLSNQKRGYIPLPAFPPGGSEVGNAPSYPPSQKTTGLPVDECANNQYATARCRPEAESDNRVVAEGEDGYFSGTTGLPVGLHPGISGACKNGKRLSKIFAVGYSRLCKGIKSRDTP